MTLHLFEGFGVEMELAIVDREDGRVRALAPAILRDGRGRVVVDLPRGPLRLSNELAAHVIELKTNGPAKTLEGLDAVFADGVRGVDRNLAEHGATLLPGGMHGRMDPETQTTLWLHENDEIYRAYDEIFGCSGHGWSNLQSVHLNLPFHGDEELGRLHAAIRLALPLLPALSAASPFADGRDTGWLDYRMEVYRHNSERVPEVAGRIVPEPVYTRGDYEREILGPMYRAIASLDPEGVLAEEWLNSRGAIARFDRDAIEIRIIDQQEAPIASVAVLRAVVAIVRALVEERPSPFEAQRQMPTGPLSDLLLATMRHGDQATVDVPGYLPLLGLPDRPTKAGRVWRAVLDAHPPPRDRSDEALSLILAAGPLARRMKRFVGASVDEASLARLDRVLTRCLLTNTPLTP